MTKNNRTNQGFNFLGERFLELLRFHFLSMILAMKNNLEDNKT